MKRPIAIMFSILLGMVIVAAAGVGGYFYLVKGHSHKSSNPKPLTPAQALALQVTLPQMLANLGDSNVVQFTLTLQADSNSTKTEVTDLQNQIEDYLIRTLKVYTSAQLNNQNGFKQLERAIRSGINRMLTTGKVTAVYFSNEIVQPGG